MDWIQQWQSKLNKQNGVAPLVRTGGSRHTGLAALPYRNIHFRLYSCISIFNKTGIITHRSAKYVSIYLDTNASHLINIQIIKKPA